MMCFPSAFQKLEPIISGTCWDPLPWQVIHRDLKPRNLLVNSNCDLKAALKCVANLGWILSDS